MARISFDTAQTIVTENENNGGNGVKFFNLKNDGEEAIVRIMHDSTDDFEILTSHKVQVGDKTRKVSCVRQPNEPTTYCPLCANNTPSTQSIFIRMIQYTNNNGQITAKPVVWERTLSYASKLRDFINEYGPLSEVIFKIKRNGKPGDKSTRYEMMFTNPQIYRNDLYPKDASLFENYSALGTIVADKSFDEISTFLATGSFPNVQKDKPQETPVQNVQPQVAPNVPPQVNSVPVVDNNPPFDTGVTPAQWGQAPAPNNVPWNNAPQVQRPNRQY